MTTDYDALYPSFRYDRPADGVLRITFDAPGLNSVGPDAHREIADIWLTVDRDPEVQVAILQGAGKGFSSGGSFELLDGIIDDYASPHQRDARGARPGVERRELLQAHRVGDPRPGGWRRVSSPGCWPTCRSSAAPRASSTATPASGSPPATTPRCVGRCCAGMAKAKYYLLTCDTLTGEEAERIGLVSLCVDDDQVHDEALEVATQLAGMSQSALRWTKHSLNHWFRQAGPTFDSSLALEFFGFGGPDAAEGVTANREKRPAVFNGPTSE